MLLAAALAWAVAVVWHEWCHLCMARLLGWRGKARIVLGSLFGPCAAVCVLPGVSDSPSVAALVRHAGWIGSLCAALVATYASWHVLLPFWWVAAGGIASDLLGAQPGGVADAFGCGNFGVLVLRATARSNVFRMLRAMLKITSVRGAQSAGLVTYERTPAHGSAGMRCRVVNGKRTDLASLLLAKVNREIKGGTSGSGSFPAPAEACRLFQGHTRFATSSICNLSGCHPHQWLPRSMQTAWRHTGGGAFVSEQRHVESYITHNGDLDFFQLHGFTYALGDIQSILGRLLGRPMPSDVDSACIAGLLDLLRTRGLWLASVRYGYLFGALSVAAGNLGGARAEQLATPDQISKVASLFEYEWRKVVAEAAQPASDAAVHLLEAHGRGKGESHELRAHCELMRRRMVERLESPDVRMAIAGNLPLPGVTGRQQALSLLVEHACNAFFFGDLLRAALELMEGAKGSFGLVLSHSLDAETDFVFAARGQTVRDAGPRTHRFEHLC